MKALQKHVTGSIKRKAASLSVADKHQLKIAKESLKLSCMGCVFLGGPNHKEALSIIHRLTGAVVGTPDSCACFS